MSVNQMMDTAVAIVQRFKQRGNAFPKHHDIVDTNDGDSGSSSGGSDSDASKKQELYDYNTLNQWRSDDSQCPTQIANYLDSSIPGWRGQLYHTYLPKAQHVVEYYNMKRNFIAPTIEENWESSKKEFEEYRALCESKAFICNQNLKASACPPSIVSYLNREAPNWLTIGHCKVYERLDESFFKAEGIIERYHARGNILPKEWRNHKDNPERAQEYKDAQKLSKWKESLKRMAEGRPGRGGHSCPQQLQDFLDSNLEGWRSEVRDKNIPAMQRAQEIVARYRQRGNVIPRQLVDRSGRPDRQQEFKDAVRLKDWKRALRAEKGGGGGKCDDDVKKYLDTNMPGWRSRVYVKQQRGAMYGEEQQDKDVHGVSATTNHKASVGRLDDNESNIISISIASSRLPSDVSAIEIGDKDTRVTSTSGHAVNRDSSNENSNFRKLDSTRMQRDIISLKRPIDDPSINTSIQKRSRDANDNDRNGRSSGHVQVDARHLSSPQPEVQAVEVPVVSNANIYNRHDDKEISAAAGLVAAHAARV